MAKTPFNIRFIFRFLGYLTFIECLFMLLSAGVGFLYHESDTGLLLQSAGITVIGALIFSLLGIGATKTIGKHESYVIVTSVWLLFSLFGAIPFYLSGHFNSFTDAYFESISGFTTTGSTALADVEVLSHCLLFWRALIQWLGGMGIILLSLAVFPILKLGGYQLFTAEVTGPVYEKIRPKLSETAKLMWFIYFGLTLLDTLLLYLGPMNIFDAVCHAFTTMATGGFSTKNANLGHWDSLYLECVTGVFMFLAGCSFILLFRLFTGDFEKIKRNDEFRWYVMFVGIFSVVLFLLLWITGDGNLPQCLRKGVFHVLSLMTTTGFYTTDFNGLHQAVRTILILLMCTGAMSGSTSGNIKIGRILLYFRTSFNELKRDVHPNAVLPVVYNGKVIPQTTVSNLFGFLFIYLLLMMFSIALFFSLGLGMEESLGVALTSIGNVGPGLGSYFGGYALLPGFAKWWMAFLMLVGRLEVYTVILLFSRSFWNKV